jgi:6-phosphogluconolactonase
MEHVRVSDHSHATAAWIAERCTSAGAFTMAVSGGSTPVEMLRQLAGLDLPWQRVHVLQVDERVAPDGDVDRNANALVPLMRAGARVHLMDVTANDLSMSARRYEALLQSLCGGVLDVVHLGIGDDGHTASWPPGDPVIEHTDAPLVAMVGPYRDRLRMTLTPAAVNGAQAIVMEAPGESKHDVVGRMIAGDRSIPAGHLRGDRTTVITD